MADEITWHHYEIGKLERSRLKGQRPFVVWFTGLSAAGKSTLAGALERTLIAQGRHTYVLDGDNLRHGLCGDLGFSEADREENIRRVGELAKMFVDAGLIVISAFISPSRRGRSLVRGLLDPGELIEVFLSTPLAVCEARDPKGLYRRARDGQLANVTGIDAPYEPPESPELTLDTSRLSVQECTDLLLAHLRAREQV